VFTFLEADGFVQCHTLIEVNDVCYSKTGQLARLV